MYKSTRGNKLYSSSEAILKGLADDGGLFLPINIKNINFNQKWLDYDYKELSKIILKNFFEDFSDDEINYVVNNAYSSNNFTDKIYDVKCFDNHAYLELYHGPTLAFKDMALTMLPHLMEVANKKINYAKKITILTATSGDTGGAALSGFKNSKNIDIVVLYPNNGVSKFQEKQMLSFTNSHAKAFALDCNFDECQTTVKNIFLNNKDENMYLSSANSINIGRLVPQIIYYFAGYLDMVKSGLIEFGEEINVCVPTGNFGNILASYFAKILGLPICDFICASNKNNVLTDFFNTGIYNIKREFYKTNTPSMDILISSNLERLLSLISNDVLEINTLMDNLKNNKEYKISDNLFNELKQFKAYYANEDETIKTIKEVYETNNYLIDPHTAVAKTCFDKYQNNNKKTLIVSTASPLKFSESIIKALDINNDLETEIYSICKHCNYPITNNVLNILNSNKEKTIMTKNEVINYIFNPKFQIKVPATSANLGVGFDVLGLSLNMFNTYRFFINDEYKVIESNIKHNDPNNNLIINSYKYVFNKLNKKEIPIFLEEIKREVPTSGGLGTSSICILTGVLAAGCVLNIKDKKKLIDMAIELEGHPDNIVPAYYGGLVANFKNNDKYEHVIYPVSDKLKFIIFYPDFKVNTHEARKALPNNLTYQDVIFNLSRIINLPKAFEEGNIKLLKKLIKDKLHEPYRLPLINEADKILNLVNSCNNSCGCISGSGAALLVISTDLNILNKLKNLKLDGNWNYKICKVNNSKVNIKVR